MSSCDGEPRVWFPFQAGVEEDHQLSSETNSSMKHKLLARLIGRNTNEKQLKKNSLYSKSSDRNESINMIQIVNSLRVPQSPFPLWWCFTIVLML